MLMVLWSPVGAPAGVPGPRRNADECDAGWFARVRALRGGGPPATGVAEASRARAAGYGRQARFLGAAPFPGGYSPLRWVIHNPVRTTRRGHFRSAKVGVFGLAEPAR